MGDRFLSRIIFVLLLPWELVFLNSCHKKEMEVYLLPGPTISSFTPASGAHDSTVVITGAGFSLAVQENDVTFNGVQATIVTATATSLVVKVPAGARDGKITVKLDDLEASSAEDFHYILTASTIAGNGRYGFANGSGNMAQFKDAYGLATDASGNIYVADGSNNRVRKITPAGVVSTLAGTGDIGYVNGDAGVAQFNYPHGVAVDATGNVYVADAGNNRIRKITPAGVVSTLAGSGDAAFADGTGTQASFNFPADLVADASGNVFVSDGSNHRIRKITPAGVVSTLRGNGATGFAEFSFPEGIAIDATSNLYIADAGGQRIYKISAAGIVSVLAGSGITGYADKTGTEAQFNDPEGIAVDALGNVYVGDLSNNAVRKITPEGVVSTAAGNGHSGFTDEIVALKAQFLLPSGIAVDTSGHIYVADVGNSRIRKLQ